MISPAWEGNVDTLGMSEITRVVKKHCKAGLVPVLKPESANDVGV